MGALHTLLSPSRILGTAIRLFTFFQMLVADLLWSCRQARKSLVLQVLVHQQVYQDPQSSYK